MPDAEIWLFWTTPGTSTSSGSRGSVNARASSQTVFWGMESIGPPIAVVGNAWEQSFEDVIAHGPDAGSAPDNIRAEVLAFCREHLGTP